MAIELPRIDGWTDLGDAEEVLPRARLVKKGSAALGLVFADAGDTPIGATLNDGDAVGDPVEYSIAGCPNFVWLHAAGIIAAGGEFIAANDGKIAAVPSEGGGTALVIGRLHPRQGATAANDLAIGRLYERPHQIIVPGGTAGNVATFDAAGQPVTDGSYAAGDAATLHSLAVEEPAAADDGKVLSYKHDTTEFVLVANDGGTLAGLAVEVPAADDDGKALVYDHGTTSWKLMPKADPA